MDNFSIADLQRQSIAEQKAKEPSTKEPTTSGRMEDDTHELVIVNKSTNKQNSKLSSDQNKLQSNKSFTKQPNHLVNNPGEILDPAGVAPTTPTTQGSATDGPEAEALGMRAPAQKHPAAVTPALDALTQAYLATLSQPFPPLDPRSPRVLVAGRVQTEVSERFEVVCTMLKKRGDKQDVLNKALQLFIEHVVRHQGDVDL